MPRATRVALLLGALVVALAATAGAQVPLDGTYTGRTTDSPFDPAITLNQYGDVTVAISDGRMTGTLDFRADTEADFGEFNEVIQRAHLTVTWEGPLQADGSFSVPGTSYSEFEIFSCRGDCSQVEAPTGNPDGYPITVTGTVADGVLEAALEWDGDPRYRIRATDPELVAASQTTTTVGTTTSTGAATTTVAGGADPTAPGIHVIGDVVYINSAPGETLELAGSDLPLWAGVILASEGDMVVTVGPPTRLVGGDPSVLLNGRPVIRLGDTTTFGGVVVGGSERIVVNGVPAAVLGSFVADPTVNPGPVPRVGGPIVATTGCRDVTVTYDGRAVCAGNGVTGIAESVAAGDDRIEVEGDDIQVGDGVVIGSAPDTMEARIVVDEGSLVLDRPLEHDHAAGEMVARIPAEHVAQAFGTEDGDGPPWVGIIALVAAFGLGSRAFMLWQRDRAS